MSGSLKSLVRADARLALLRVLAQDRGYSQNHSILRLAIDKATAITLTDDEVKEHVHWLEDRGLVASEEVPPYLLARLTDRGLSVARGEAEVEGVSRPRPDQTA